MSRQIYAFRVFSEDSNEPWYGYPEALPADQYETGFWTICENTSPSPFYGKLLELRHGELPEEDTEPMLVGYSTISVAGHMQAVAFQSELVAILFPGHS